MILAVSLRRLPRDVDDPTPWSDLSPTIGRAGNGPPPAPAACNQLGAGSGGTVAPSTVLPVQFFASLQRQAPHRTGEYRLLVAVLDDAIRCLKLWAFPRIHRERRLFEETERWIMDDGSSPTNTAAAPILSFEHVCCVLGIDPAGVRQRQG